MMERLRRFMIGRYGVDELTYAFLITLIILHILSLFLRSFIVSVLYIALFAFMIFRMLSKNIAARRKENYFFLKAWNPVAAFFRRLALKIKTRKQYKYLTCPECKKKMRVPRGKGNIIVTCPKCGNRKRIKS